MKSINVVPVTVLMHVDFAMRVCSASVQHNDPLSRARLRPLCVRLQAAPPPRRPVRPSVFLAVLLVSVSEPAENTVASHRGQFVTRLALIRQFHAANRRVYDAVNFIRIEQPRDRYQAPPFVSLHQHFRLGMRRISVTRRGEMV